MTDVYDISENKYPLIALRGYWPMPSTFLSFDAKRSISVNAVEDARLRNTNLFFVNQKDVFDDNPKKEGLYEFGIVASIKDTFELPNGVTRVFVDPIGVARLDDLEVSEGFLKANVCEFHYREEEEKDKENLLSLKKILIDDFKEYISLITMPLMK